MSTPVLHVLAGPNGAGKSTLATRVLVPTTGLHFVNADVLAETRWPDDREAQRAGAHVVAREAADLRAELLSRRTSFVTETVFSHPSKVALVEDAVRVGYLVTLHVVMVPVEVSVRRVRERVDLGGHQVPEESIRSRYARLWALTAQASGVADRALFYDNTRADAPFRRVAEVRRGVLLATAAWPTWTPPELLAL